MASSLHMTVAEWRQECNGPNAKNTTALAEPTIPCNSCRSELLLVVRKHGVAASSYVTRSGGVGNGGKRSTNRCHADAWMEQESAA